MVEGGREGDGGEGLSDLWDEAWRLRNPLVRAVRGG
jgi:hypothetical protein